MTESFELMSQCPNYYLQIIPLTTFNYSPYDISFKNYVIYQNSFNLPVIETLLVDKVNNCTFTFAGQTQVLISEEGSRFSL